MAYLLYLLFALVLFFFENSTGTRAVFLASLMLPVAAVLLSRWQSREELVWDVPGEVRKGEKIVLRLTHPRFWLCRVEGNVHLQHALTGEVRTLPWEDGLCAICHDCGSIRISMGEARVWDVLHLVPRRVSVAYAEVRVLPELYGVTVSGGPETAGKKAPWGERDDEVRDYVPGDPVRNIHWKLTAKLDRTVVRGTVRSAEQSLALVWDTQSREAPERLEALLSVSSALECPHTVIWPGPQGLRTFPVQNGREDGLMYAMLEAERTDLPTDWSAAEDADRLLFFSSGERVPVLTGNVLMVCREAGQFSDLYPCFCVSRDEPFLDLG